MQQTRGTAVLTITLAGTSPRDVLALDMQREYRFSLHIDDKTLPGGPFRSPFGDEQFRDVIQSIRMNTSSSPSSRDPQSYEDHRKVLTGGKALYEHLCGLSTDLANFLTARSGPRRLVIDTQRPEIHQLPWEAMVGADWSPLARSDVSVVRTTDGFAPEPDVSGPVLRIQPMFGPHTEQRTLATVTRLAEEAKKGRHSLVVLPEGGGPLPGADSGQQGAEVVHIEAHGDERTGQVSLPEWACGPGGAPAPSELARRIGPRKVVLLWSCYSAMVHSWGESPALSLHRDSGATFVLAFSTPLHYDASVAIADYFYGKVFQSRGTLDPESAVVEARRWLFHEDAESCNWASMTLWLRRPLDLSTAVQDGPRLPSGPGEWTEDEGLAAVPEATAAAFRHKAVPGSVVRLSEQELPRAFPYRLAESFRGAAVHLRRTDLAGEEISVRGREIFERLGAAAPKSRHPGDRFLALLDALATYRSSLLIWSGITGNEAKLVEVLSREMPQNVALVLFDGGEPGAGVGVKDAPDASCAPAAPGHAAPVPAELERLEGLNESGQYATSVMSFEELKARAEQWGAPERMRFYSCGYWSLIRLERKTDAERCVEAVEELSEVEGLLLRGNFVQRAGFYNQAQSFYERAREAAGGPVDRARAMLELGYLHAQLGEAPLAESYFQKSIGELEQVNEKTDDLRWRSALGRALRDYADMLTKGHGLPADAERQRNCLALLRRAFAIHALDGRHSQIAAALETRGKLELALGRTAEAEGSLLAAASLLYESGNLRGWARIMPELAQFGLDQGRDEQALVMLEGSFRSLTKRSRSGTDGGESYDAEAGVIALRTARAYWARGEVAKTYEWSQHALDLLPDKRQGERAEATNLGVLARSLGGGVEPPGGSGSPA